MIGGICAPFDILFWYLTLFSEIRKEGRIVGYLVGEIRDYTMEDLGF